MEGGGRVGKGKGGERRRRDFVGAGEVWKAFEREEGRCRAPASAEFGFEYLSR